MPEQKIPREKMDYDIVIVGGGPAGLSAAVRLKQLGGEGVSVCVLEKGSEIGSHILSGAILNPYSLFELFPNWQALGAPLETQVSEDHFYFLTSSSAFKVPDFFKPKLLSNHGNYVISLGLLCRWLAKQAQELGVEIYPGFSCSEVLYREDGAVCGVVAGVFGLDEKGVPKPSYQPGVEILGKYVFFAEGARGSLSKEVIGRFHLDKGRSPQKFGLGMKEIWEVPASNHKSGRTLHTLGWPLNRKTGGGGFLYHWGENLISVGFVVHLDYDNPHLFPYMEGQRFKHHPLISEMLTGGKRVAYGARVITEGGYQSVPQLTFPGGVLVGCAAGFVNVPQIKGSHNAIKSGMLAAEAAFLALREGRAQDRLVRYEAAYQSSEIAKELKQACNVKPLWSRFGLFGGLLLGGADLWMNTLIGRSLFGVLPHLKPDHATLKLASESKPIAYPKPDGILSFDRLTNVAFSNTFHEEGQPVHLKLQDPTLPVAENLPRYAEPAERYCPAHVYEIVEDTLGQKKFQINAQNCVHCKTCDIKDPAQNITWCPPQGGEGPNYTNM